MDAGLAAGLPIFASAYAMSTDPISPSEQNQNPADQQAAAQAPAAEQSPAPDSTGGKRGPLAAGNRKPNPFEAAQSGGGGNRGGAPRGGGGGGPRGPSGGQGQRGPGPGGPKRDRGPRPGGPQRPGGEGQPQADENLTAEQRERRDEEAAEEKARNSQSGPAPPVPVPSIRGPLADDLEAEINEALGGMSLEEMIAERPVSSGRLENESRHRAQVVDIHGDNVFFSLGGKNQGVCSLRNFETPPEVGSMLDVIVTGYSAEDGLHDVAVPGGSLAASGADWSSIVDGSLVEARITGANTGGLEAMVNGIRAFIPASQISLFRTENLPDFVGQKMVCVVTEANERRGNLVLSRRAVLEREKEESKKQLLGTLQVGDMREGVVRKIHDFGAFCDLGGVDGLIHISQLSWDRVKHPSDVLKEGEKVRVRIEKIDADTGKISLSLRNLEEHPWSGIDKRFPVGSMVRGPVSRIAEFGAFVKLAPGVEGLIHISELAHHRVFAVKNVVKEGQEVEAKVISIDPDAQRMSLSLKAAIAKPMKEDEKKAETVEVDEPPRPLAVPKRSGPLKGGIGKSSGGDQFGLKW